MSRNPGTVLRIARHAFLLGSDLEKEYAISEAYYFIDPLAPFGVGYEEFGADLELVTDQQFTNWGEANYSSIRADTTEDEGCIGLERIQ